MPRRRKKRMEATVELDITAFMNLMVILVPFLLITAVFSRMTILELNLPPKDAKPAAENQQEIKLNLQLLIAPEQYVIQDATLGVLKTIARDASFDDEQRQKNVWQPMSDMLVEVKRRFPDVTAISLLLSPEVDYKTMIQVMDRVRATDIVEAASLVTVELFPDVSVGDLPTANADDATLDVEGE